MLTKLFSILPDAFKAIDSVFTSDEERLKAKTDMMKITNEKYAKSVDLEMAQMEAETRLKEKQAEVIVAEAQSGDKYTSRARPTAMYLFLGVIAWYFISISFGWPVPPPEVMEHVWDAVSVCLGGYIGARTLEKGVKMFKGGKGKDV